MDWTANWIPLRFSDGEVRFVASTDVGPWSRDALGNVTLNDGAISLTASVAGDITFTSTGSDSDITLAATGTSSDVVISSASAEVVLTAQTYFTATATTETASLLSGKTTVGGTGVQVKTTGGANLNIVVGNTRGNLNIISQSVDILSVACTGSGSIQLSTASGTIQIISGNRIDLTSALGQNINITSGVGGATVLEGEQVDPSTGNTNGNVLTRVAGVWIGQAPSGGSTVLTTNHIFVGDGSNVATDVAMSGDATIVASGALTLANTAVTPATYGDSTHVGQFTVDSKGRITSASNVVIAGSGGVATDAIWDAKGDLAGGTGADTAAKLTVGANNSLLVADSTQTTGLKWTLAPTGLTSLGISGDLTFTGARTITSSSTLIVQSSASELDLLASTFITMAATTETVSITSGKNSGTGANAILISATSTSDVRIRNTSSGNVQILATSGFVNISGPTNGVKIQSIPFHPNAVTTGQTLRYDGTAMVPSTDTPTGQMMVWPGSGVPTGWLLCDGSAVSRTTYATLFGVLIRTATITVTIASPGVVTWTAHGLIAGDPILFTTTGALPTGITASTTYYVKTVNDANSFTITATVNGTAVVTTGSQSGTHTGKFQPWGVGDGSTTFNVPNPSGKNLRGIDPTGGANAYALAGTGGGATHNHGVTAVVATPSLTIPNHTHPLSSTNGYAKIAPTAAGGAVIFLDRVTVGSWTESGTAAINGLYGASATSRTTATGLGGTTDATPSANTVAGTIAVTGNTDSYTGPVDSYLSVKWIIKT